MKNFYRIFIVSTLMLLTACSPHPSSGVWMTTDDNVYGITRLVIGFEGRAEFVTPKLDNASWHCFWNASSSQQSSLKCKPSTDSDQEEEFNVTVNEQGLAELTHGDIKIAVFTRQDENPSPKD